MKRMPVFAVFLAIIFLTGCNSAEQVSGPRYDPFSENPITITWRGEATEVESYQANVHVFTMNNRTDTHAVLNHTYRMAVSSIGDRVLTRIDLDLDSDIPFRSVISDGEETIVFSPVTEEIGYRVHDPTALSPLNRIFGQMTGLSRVNLPLIRQEAARLSLSMREESEDGVTMLLLELPPALLLNRGTDTIISSRAAFDISSETLLETEVVMKHEDGTLVTTTVTPVYEEANGVPVKVGQVTIIDSQAPGLIEGVDDDMPMYESPDDIPEISESELAELEARGGASEIPEMIFGNPADLSYVETIYEVYLDIEINDTPEHLFRLLQ